jgi:hypothetical protein
MNRLCPNCNKTYNNRGSLCAPCYQRKYYKTNKLKIKEQKAIYYQVNKDNIDQKSKEYRNINTEKVKLKNRQHYHKNKNNILKYQKDISKSPKRKFQQGVKAAMDRQIEWLLCFEEYAQLIEQPCHYCKTSLETWGGTSLDRINNDLGYIITNVLPCCGTCNNIRNKFLTVKEMEVAMNAILEYRKSLDNSESNNEI